MTRRPKPAPPRPPFPAAGLPLLGTVSDRVLAAQLGVPASAVTREREHRQVPTARPGPRARGPDKRSERLQALVTPAVMARVDAARGEVSRSDWTATAVVRALDGQTETT